MMTVEELAAKLAALGCPEDRAPAMARQLDKRAHQLAQARQRTYAEALEHLLGLMSEGWAARNAGE